jgi:hypothetical protein
VKDPIGRLIRTLMNTGKQRALAGELWPWAIVVATLFVLRKQRRDTPPRTYLLERGATMIVSSGPSDEFPD